MVTKQDLLPLDGGDTDTEDSDLEDEPWEDPGSNEGSAYFFGAPGRFDTGSVGGGDGGVSSATSGKGHGSWRDIVQGKRRRAFVKFRDILFGSASWRWSRIVVCG